MIKIGDIEIHRLNESRVWMDSGGVFGLVPRALWSQVVTPDADSRLPNDHWCLLVRAGGRVIVVDTGQDRQPSLGSDPSILFLNAQLCVLHEL